MPYAINSSARPVVFGEVLFDVLPGNKEILGGAPFNVAWHLQAFGYQPLVISRVGNDSRGERIQNTMEEWEMDARGLQVDSTHPTGIVNVSHGDTGPKFHIEPNQAYDYISGQDALMSIGDESPSLILHGTLAIRSRDSYEALAIVREKLQAPAFVDLNVRAPWWNPAIVGEVLKNARWVKANDEELKIISEKETLSEDQYAQAATQLMEQYKNIELLFVTLGGQGAFAVTRSGELFRERGIPIPDTEFRDSVGAGDAFTAVAIIGLLKGWKTDMILQRANRFASEMCKIPGATTTNRNIYKILLQSWTE